MSLEQKKGPGLYNISVLLGRSFSKLCNVNKIMNVTKRKFKGLLKRTVGIHGEKLSDTALGTAKVLKFFDGLMDSVNGYPLCPTAGKILRCAVS
nr:unnamed protein product [Callosobruchus analis]